MNTGAQQAVTANAAIAQEPVTCTVRYAITGDHETDLIAGIMAVFNENDEKKFNPVNGPQDLDRVKFRKAQRICEYLVGRFKQIADEIEHHQRQDEIRAARMAAMQGRTSTLPSSGLPGYAGSGTPTDPYYGHPGYTTSGGSLPAPLTVSEESRRMHAAVIRAAADRAVTDTLLEMDKQPGKPLAQVFMEEQAKKLEIGTIDRDEVIERLSGHPPITPA